MQKIILILLCWSTCSGLFAQALVEADQMPYFPGCERYKEGSDERRQCSNHGIISFISNYLEYPESAKKEQIEGTVYVSFVVEKNGTVTQPKLLRDIGNGCGEAALEVLRKMPTWEPGIDGGDKVAVQLNLPVKFSFTGEEGGPEDPPYKIHWGKLKSNEVSRKGLLANSIEPIQVRDLYGNEIPLGEVLFTYEKNRTYLDAKSNGRIDKNMMKVLKRSRKGGVFAIVATIQKDGEFVYVERALEVVE